jgi:hypothetical protein
VLSPQTQAQLLEMQKANGEQIAAQAAEDANAAKEEEKKSEDDPFDLFDFYGRDESSRILNNKKRRKEIEARCAPMSFEDLLMKDEVEQVVPVLPEGKFNVKFRSLRPSESLFIKQFMATSEQKSEQYYIERYSLCQLAMAVVEINGKPLGAPHLKDGGEEVDEKVFAAKLKMLTKKSGYIVADLGINYSWFDVRVRKLLNPDDLGNG